MQQRLLACCLSLALCGCTHQQLKHSTALTNSTVMEIQYQTVLTNLAMMSAHPESLPSHADLADGVVQINDRLGFGQSGGFTTFAGGVYGFGIDRIGPSGHRQVTEQWGADATTHPQRLIDLQDLYRTALGLAPLPPPNAIAYLRRRQQRPPEEIGPPASNSGSKTGNGQQDNSPDDSTRIWRLPSPADSPVSWETVQPSPASSGGDGSILSADESDNVPENGDRRVPIHVLLTDVPAPGWYQFGCKQDVPKDACYVGCFGGRYCWVMPEGVPDLARFTVTVLAVVKLAPGEAPAKTGLAFTQ